MRGLLCVATIPRAHVDAIDAELVEGLGRCVNAM
jgi:hypothetical protein